MNLKNSLITLGLLVILSVIHLSIQTANMNMKYEVEDLKRKLIPVNREIRELLRLEAEAKDLKKIETRALGGLNMIRPERINYVFARPRQ